MKNLILLIDDDRLPIQYYVKALELKGFEVKHCLEPDSALAFARNKAKEIACIIMDIMMSPGKTYENYNTKAGLITGSFLLEGLREKDCCPNTPVVVLTNVKNPKTIEKFKNRYSIEPVQKMEYPPFEFAKLIEKIILEAKK